jgi:hypothetical protein
VTDLNFFFKAVALHPELQKIMDYDIKDLLGVRHSRPQEYGFMISALLRSILISKDGQKNTNRDDFRLRLNSEIQGIVIEKVTPFLSSVFNNVHAEHGVRDDLVKAWAWTRMVATDKEFGDPRRTFDLSDSQLLKE